MSLRSYLEAIPKIELHVHLEGSTQPETLLELADRNGIRLPKTTVEGLREMYVFHNFDEDFIPVYMMIVDCIRTEQDLSDLAYRFGQDMARQNIRYSEVTWTPQLHAFGNSALPFSVALAALNDGRARAYREFGVDMRWITDITRNLPEHADAVTDWVISNEARDGGVVALGLGGFEVGFPPEMFEAQFQRAIQAGMPSNPHAGETLGAESVYGAIHNLGARRIGHGVRAIEDPDLVSYLAEYQVPLEVNPTSNLCLKIYPSYAEHPLKRLLEAGCLVTVNSDDPPLFNTTLTDEYQHAIEDCGLSRAQLEKTILDAIRVTYLSNEEKKRLVSEFEAQFARLQVEHLS